MDEFKPKRKMKTVVYQMYVCLYNGGCGNCWHNDRPDCCRQLLMKDALYYLQQTLEKSEKKRSVKMENKFGLGQYAKAVEQREKIEQIGTSEYRVDVSVSEEEFYAIVEAVERKRKEKYEKVMRMGSFDYAIRKVLDGRKMKRLGWNGKDQYIELASNISYQRPNGEVVNPDHKMIGNSAIAFYGTSGVQVGWLASQADMLSGDWVEVED